MCKNDCMKETQKEGGGEREMVRERGVHRVHERVCSTRERGERERGEREKGGRWTGRQAGSSLTQFW